MWRRRGPKKTQIDNVAVPIVYNLCCVRRLVDESRRFGVSGRHISLHYSSRFVLKYGEREKHGQMNQALVPASLLRTGIRSPLCLLSSAPVTSLVASQFSERMRCQHIAHGIASLDRRLPLDNEKVPSDYVRGTFSQPPWLALLWEFP